MRCHRSHAAGGQSATGGGPPSGLERARIMSFLVGGGGGRGTVRGGSGWVGGGVPEIWGKQETGKNKKNCPLQLVTALQRVMTLDDSGRQQQGTLLEENCVAGENNVAGRNCRVPDAFGGKTLAKKIAMWIIPRSSMRRHTKSSAFFHISRMPLKSSKP